MQESKRLAQVQNSLPNGDVKVKSEIWAAQGSKQDDFRRLVV